MRHRQTSLIWLLILGCLGATALACNLSAEPQPILPPRASATPPPTIGYATLAPNQLPSGVVPVTTPTQNLMAALLAQVDGTRLMQHVTTLESFQTRHVNSFGNPTRGIDAARDYILAEFQAIADSSTTGFQVDRQEFRLLHNDIESFPQNIIGVLPGTEIGAGVLLIGAHYDSVIRDWNDASSFAPGANDNATGVAALIEIARLMSQRQHRMTIMFVAFSAEEVQRQGSIEFVRAIGAGGIDLRAMFNMDIIGSSTGANGAVNDSQIRIFSEGPDDSPSRQLARGLELLNFFFVPDLEIVVQDAADRPNRYSDHMSFSERGYAAVRFIEAAEDTTIQHTQQDTSDRIELPYLVRSTQNVLALATAYSLGPPPPQTLNLRDNGDGTRTLLWDPVPGAVRYYVALRPVGSQVYEDYFPLADNEVTWNQFVSSTYVGVAVMAEDANGLIGMTSLEYRIP